MPAPRTRPPVPPPEPPVPGVVDTSRTMVRTNRLFVALRQIGHLSATGKLVFATGYSGRSVAAPDRPLSTVAFALIEEIVRAADYSTPEAAAADVANFKRLVAELHADPAVAVVAPDGPPPPPAAVARSRRGRR